MELNRAVVVDQNLRARLKNLSAPAQRSEPGAALTPSGSLNGCGLLQILNAQLASRALDLVAREMRARGEGFYTIGSSGHEGNALVGFHSRVEDMAFLHYRSGAFMMARALKAGGQSPIYDTCLSLAASRLDPIAGGRHKVWGSLELNVPPQTSTIASHLPKAVGAAFAIGRCPRHLLNPRLSADSIMIASFGDASLNHSTTQGALSAAGWAAQQNIPLPILFVCEDNGIGISVATPENWVADSIRGRANIHYIAADGRDALAASDSVAEAIRLCRHRRRPVFLHLRTVRLMGHAGSDAEHLYRTEAAMEKAEAQDPLLETVSSVVRQGLMSPTEVLELYDETLTRTRLAAVEACRQPRHESAETIVEPLQLRLPLAPAPSIQDPEKRRKSWQGSLPEEGKARPMARQINDALHDILLGDERCLIFGEDVAAKGGVYTVTRELTSRFGLRRVFNTLLDEQTILGLAIGAGHIGLLPFPEIQYLAYLHNAVDQIRGEACSLGFFSERRFANPMVVRIAGLAYQKGFGGHFHNDNSFSSLRDIPSLIVCSPSTPSDAARLLRSAYELAKQRQSVVIFLEPIALYMTKDLLVDGDNLYQETYPAPEELAEPMRARFFEPEGHDPQARIPILVISFSNGCYLSRQARADLGEDARKVRILDLRWLNPLPESDICQAAKLADKIIIVDEGRRTGGLSEAIFTLLCEQVGGDSNRWSRIVGEDTYIPLGRAWEYVLPSRASIAAALRTGLKS